MPHLDVSRTTFYCESDGHAAGPPVLRIRAAIENLTAGWPLVPAS